MSNLIRQATEQLPSVPRGTSVLIIDPDRQMRSLIAEWLEKAGYTCVQAHSCVAPLEATPCDIVLVDVCSPLQSAREAIASIRAALPLAAVIAMSADALASGPSAMESVERGLGVAAVLVKPFDRNALLKGLARALKPI